MAFLLPQPSLFEDAVQRAGRQIVPRLARYGDATRLFRMPVLAVATAGAFEIPAILLEHPQYVSNLHSIPPSPVALRRQALCSICTLPPVHSSPTHQDSGAGKGLGPGACKTLLPGQSMRQEGELRVEQGFHGNRKRG